MRLGQLIETLPGLRAVQGDLDVEISLITADSRQVVPGALFVAYRGVGVDGARYVPDALRRGAVAVAGEVEAGNWPVPYVQVDNGRAALAWLHAAWYGHPSRSMTIVGITGTDGKTTTANVLFGILKTAGLRAAMISTVNAIIGDQGYDTGLHTTTPDAADVQRLLAQMRDAGTEIAVLETTSHGLAQHRVGAIDFDIAVVTNITHEHLDFHGSYEAYRDAKAILFRSLLGAQGGAEDAPRLSGGGPHAVTKTAILNADDGSFPHLAAIPAERYIVYTAEVGDRAAAIRQQFGATARVTVLQATGVRQAPAGMSFEVRRYEAGISLPSMVLTTHLVGRYNVSNILAAAGAALALGIHADVIAEGIAAFESLVGRMERIDRGQPFTAVVDFAHTPNALAAVISAAHQIIEPEGRVIVVFGSAGLRDREKRRLMGRVSARLADYTVITAEDPRTENLDAIIAETADAMIAEGRVEGVDFVREGDRQSAILHAVRNARPGDIVLVCGKGHEQSMCFGTVEHPWRDQDALAWALERLGGAADTPPPFPLPTWLGLLPI